MAQQSDLKPLFKEMSDEEKIVEILLYGKVLSNKLLCIRFNIEKNELWRLLIIHYGQED